MGDYGERFKKGDEDDEDRGSKTPLPAAMRLNIAPAVPRKVVAPIVAVPTYSPAYAKGGMVRGCGKAVKGRGKVKVY